MKKVLLLMTTMTTILASNSIKAIESLTIDHLSGSLNQNANLLSFDEFQYNGAPLEINSSLSQIETSFVNGLFSGRHHELNLKYDFGKESALAGINQIQTDDLNLRYQQGESLSFSTTGITLSHSGGKQHIPELSLKCKNNSKSLITDISSQCLSLAELSIPELIFDQISGIKMAEALLDTKALKSLDELENLKLLIFDGSFQMQFKVKYVFNWNVKSNGTIKFDQEKKLLSIYLDKAKVGIISLKSKILDQIKNANLESVTVSGSTINIQL